MKKKKKLRHSCKRETQNHHSDLYERAQKAQASRGSGGMLPRECFGIWDFNSLKSPLSHSDTILASSILLGWSLANRRIISSLDFNLESLLLKIYLLWKIWPFAKTVETGVDPRLEVARILAEYSGLYQTTDLNLALNFDPWSQNLYKSQSLSDPWNLLIPRFSSNAES